MYALRLVLAELLIWVPAFAQDINAGAGSDIATTSSDQASGPAQLTRKRPVRVKLANNVFSPVEELYHAGLAGTVTAMPYDQVNFPYGFVYNHTHIAADQLTFDSTMTGREVALGQSVEYLFGGGAATGARIALGAFATLQAPMAATDSNTFYGAGWDFARALTNNGGTSSTALVGNLFGSNPQTQLTSGATFWNSIETVEADTEIDSGASAGYKFGINSTTVGSDAVHALFREAALHVGAVPSSGGWNMGLMFSDFSGGGVPISSNGTLIGSAGNVGTVFKGVDFSAFTFTGPAFAAPTLTLGGDYANGNVAVGKATGTGTPYIDLLGASNMRIVGDATNQVTIASPTTGPVMSIVAAAGANKLTLGGTLTANTIVEAHRHTPVSSSEHCVTGTQAWDTNYEYRCVATNTWKRAALSNW